MNREAIRGFALGMLLSTSIIGIIYYQQPVKSTKAQLDAYLQKNELVVLAKTEYQALKKAAETKAQAASPKTTAPPATIRIYRLVINKGDVPTKFAKELEEAKIISDDQALTNYLNAHQLTGQIRPGTYEIRSDMKYEEIARMITHSKR
ncbi:yceG-like family protein [Anoxybacillus sp. B7M1]|uniref:endolytic transglycosylase MltG n=1 Tax=unclassified Anoxybacillus TaxID=2639704 RepID=UPI0005CD803E|nr:MULTISPECIES: endolytic transglycosylase MltG [unclassified Anoxybacillus]ANB56257.1 yceG-like family protein [Anoxybacillus sp. B2M1]ANB63317.1 yceG-like family protein [Anoxybacillus sp. B7M1]